MGPPTPPMGKEVRRAEPIATDSPRDTIAIAGWQTLLDRMNFSCGTIDGHFAKRSRRAITQFQIHRTLATTGELDIETRINLGKPGDAYIDYILTPDDLLRVVSKPKGYVAMSKAAVLDFNDPWEMLSEKTHSTPSFLKELNPTITNLVAGMQLTLPNLDGTRKLPPVSRIVIMISETTLLAFDTNNKVVACFPCSIAANKTKVPNVPLTVANIAPNPNYTFDPKVLLQVAQQEGITNKLMLPPGPNNPVGTAWIGLSLQGYGIHGTPEPEDISRTGSHGCFRLANWNASKLVRAVRPGIPVEVVP
jgi:lipoprotein-anchoring transpeptidase ErfK/SrfK